MKMFKPILCFGALLVAVYEILGHGMMLQPPGRSSLWRYDSDAKPNYDDNQLFCGGLYILWTINKGKCGVCGDIYTDSHPQPNENRGLFGSGKIVAEYKAGDVIETSVLITANHNGHFEYHLCQIHDSTQPESGEECFQQLTFENGADKFPVLSSYKRVTNRVQLPADFTCEHCVLRWHYRGGNNWGICNDGKGEVGCGPQEFFRSCADIRIV